MKKFITSKDWKKKFAFAFFVFSTSLINAAENNEIDLDSVQKISKNSPEEQFMYREVKEILKEIQSPQFNGKIDFQKAEKLIKYYSRFCNTSQPSYFLGTHSRKEDKEKRAASSKKDAKPLPDSENISMDLIDENGINISEEFKTSLMHIQEITIPLKNSYFYKKMRKDIQQTSETLKRNETSLSYEASIFLKIFGILFHDKKVILDCGDESEIDHGCLQGLRSVKSLLIQGKNIEKIGEFFLAGCTDLKEITFVGFNNVRTIGQYFLFRCKKLENIDLGFLSKLSVIPDTFMSECYSLKKIDLSPLQNVTQIGNEFLQYCESLNEIDLNPLGRINAIGTLFISNCYELKNVYIPQNWSLKNRISRNYNIIEDQYNQSRQIVLQTQDDLLGEINRLFKKVEIDKMQMKSVFFVDLLKLNRYAEKINNPKYKYEILTKIKSIKTVIIPLEDAYFQYKTKKSQDAHFQYNDKKSPQEKLYYSIDYVDPFIVRDKIDELTYFSNIIGDKTVILDCQDATEIDDYCLSSIHHTKQIIVEGEKVEKIGNCFINSCIDVERIDLSKLKSLKSIGRSFVSNNHGLKEINLSALKDITDIPDAFMSFNKSLKSIDLSPLRNVRAVGSGFLSYCNVLSEINLTPFANVKSIQDGFLLSCYEIKNAIIPSKWIFKDKVYKGYGINIIEDASIHIDDFEPTEPSIRTGDPKSRNPKDSRYPLADIYSSSNSKNQAPQRKGFQDQKTSNAKVKDSDEKQQSRRGLNTHAKSFVPMPLPVY
ncbi:MAG: hypothetical protein CNLJKLNK_01205 [Holosporales bacterium]